MRALIAAAICGWYPMGFMAGCVAGCLIGCTGEPPTPSPDAAAVDDASPTRPLDLRPPPDLTPVLGPMRLSDTGLYSDFAARTLSPGIIHYIPRYELWADGADKDRYLLIPPNTKIDTTDMDNWVFPVGTKVWKEFRVGGKLIETRIVQKVYPNPGGWWAVGYLWNADGTNAVAVPDGTPDAGVSGHEVPSQVDCGKCHANVSDMVIGVSAIQLSSASGKGPLSDLIAAGLLSSPPAVEFQPPGQGNVKDALGYLHGNCGHCHNTRSIYDHATVLKLRLRVTDITPESTDIYKTSINIKMYHHLVGEKVDYAVVPGVPEMSQLWVRMGLRDDWQMPPVASKIADPVGVAIVKEWILSLPH